MDATNDDYQKASTILSNIVVHLKYARYDGLKGRRETWDELVTRNKLMHIAKFPQLSTEIEKAYQYVYRREVMPSMRSLQFSGKACSISPSRMYNCCYMAMDSQEAFSEAMFLLLGGTGVGFSVQLHHVRHLPVVRKRLSVTRRFLIADSIEGWADAIKYLVESYFKGSHRIAFDYRDIRAKGTLLKTSGGRAPGSAPLALCLERIEAIFEKVPIGERLRPIDVYDCMCHIGDSILSGGIRRSAMICLFSATDGEMLTAKSGSWWINNSQRGRSNNSVVLLRDRCTLPFFKSIWKLVEDSKCGEPGIYWTKDKDLGTNPCVEVSLRPCQFCNLTEINATTITSNQMFIERARAAAFIGTLQAAYTDFHYLRPVWKEVTEKERLLGVSITGIANNSFLSTVDLTLGASAVREENQRVAAILGINTAARTTCVKPSGTVSLVVGSSSGIHAWHSKYYLRRIRIMKVESLYRYLNTHLPALVEDEKFNPATTAVITIPQMAPAGAILRSNESCMDLLQRVAHVTRGWVRPGHVTGRNCHNVSVTLTLRDGEWHDVGQWLYKNRELYAGMAVLPFDGHTYVQMPFEECNEQTYLDMCKHLEQIDLRFLQQVRETEDHTTLRHAVACAGGKCEL